MQQKAIVGSIDELRNEIPNTEKILYYRGRNLTYEYDPNITSDEAIFDIYFQVVSSVVSGGWRLVGGVRVFNIYVSETGNDTNDGLTPASPIRTTDGLKKYLGDNLDAPDTVLILKGDITSPDFTDENGVNYKNFYVNQDITIMHLVAENVHFLFAQTWQTTDYFQFDNLPPISNVKINVSFNVKLTNCVFDCNPNQSFFGQISNQAVMPKDKDITPLFNCNNFEWNANGRQYLCFLFRGKYTRLIADCNNAVVNIVSLRGEASGNSVAMFKAEKVVLNVIDYIGYFTKHSTPKTIHIKYSSDTVNDVLQGFNFHDLRYSDNKIAKAIEHRIVDTEAYVEYIPTNYLKWNGPIDDVWNAVQSNFPRAYLRQGQSVWKLASSVVYKDITVNRRSSISFSTFGSVIDIKEVILSPTSTTLTMDITTLTTQTIDTWNTPVYKIVIPQNATYDYNFVIELADNTTFTTNVIQIVVPTGYYQQSQLYDGTNAMSSANQYDITYGVLFAIFGAIIPDHTRRYMRFKIVSSTSLPATNFYIATVYHIDKLQIPRNKLFIIDRGNTTFPSALTFREYQIINNKNKDRIIRITLLP